LRGGHPNCSGHLAQDSGFGRHWLDTARKTLHSLSDFCLAQQARAKRARWTADLGSEKRPRSCVRISAGSSTRARTELHASPHRAKQSMAGALLRGEFTWQKYQHLWMLWTDAVYLRVIRGCSHL